MAGIVSTKPTECIHLPNYTDALLEAIDNEVKRDASVEEKNARFRAHNKEIDEIIRRKLQHSARF